MNDLAQAISWVPNSVMLTKKLRNHISKVNKLIWAIFEYLNFFLTIKRCLQFLVLLHTCKWNFVWHDVLLSILLKEFFYHCLIHHNDLLLGAGLQDSGFLKYHHKIFFYFHVMSTLILYFTMNKIAMEVHLKFKKKNK